MCDNKVDFTLTKVEKGWWSRLTSQPQKPAWLKIDFDRWQSEEDLNDDEDVRDVMEDYPDLYDQLQKEEMGYRKEDLKKVYMVLYNLFMFIGFFYICIVIGIRYLRDGVDSIAGTYEAVGGAMRLVQLTQMMEVLHAIMGYTRSNVLATTLQVCGRNVVLFGLIHAEERLQTKPVIFYLFLVWAAIEVVRYPYYITQLYKKENDFLTWLRYSLWIPLYPLGFVCEGVVILRGLLYFDETGKFSIAMPNSWNFTFHYPTFLRIYLLFFSIPIMYMLISQMYKARQRKLNPKTIKKIK